MTFQDIVSRDPEEVGEETFEDTWYRGNLAESIHEPILGPNGRCTVPTRKYCYEHQVTDYHQECGAEYWSVLHTNDDLQSQDSHYHGGGDCMCFEGYAW